MRDRSPVVAVIQARMSSSRLPGKVLLPIAGKPLLWHLVYRLKKCQTVDSVAVATSTDSRDDELAAFCANEGIRCVRGSLDNVLDRYRQAAEETGAQTLLRITGDSPFIDPEFIDFAVTGLLREGADYVRLAVGAVCAHEGADAMSRAALDYLVGHAAQDPVAREHVTSWFKLHPDAVKTAVLPEYAPLAVENVRLSVDTADDLAFVRAVYDRLGAAPGELLLTEVLKLLKQEPRYRQINAHVLQKPITQRERHALICCQGGSGAGLGHLRRSLSLARALRDVHGFGVSFTADHELSGFIQDAGFTPLFQMTPAMLAKSRRYDLAIVDVKDALARSDVESLAAEIPVVAVIDDGSDRRLAATHAYYPPVPQAFTLSWEGASCKTRIGWEWCILGFDPAQVVRRPEASRVVVSLGGADPLGLSGTAVDALQQISIPLLADIVIGPAFAQVEALMSHISQAGPAFHARTGVRNLPELFARSDLALVAFGITAYELAALGVPALYLPMSDDHARSASIFVEAGIGEALPCGATPGQIAEAVSRLLRDEPRRRSMASAGPRHVDAKGAFRIAAELAEAVNSQTAADLVSAPK